MKRFTETLSFTVLFFLLSCNPATKYDLALRNALVFDAKEKQLLPNKTILIKGDKIEAVVGDDYSFSARKKIDLNGKLVTPGFVDTHIHLTDILGNYEDAPDSISVDSFAIYQQRIADVYLPYGTTTILEVGHPEKWLPATTQWQKKPSPDFPNLFVSGGALISDETRNPYLGHLELATPIDAEKKIQEYYDLGIRHIKLYWRLRPAEMKAVIKKAAALDMYVCGHIDQNIVSIDSAMDYGVKHFEHFLTTAFSVFSYEEHLTDFREKMDLPVIKTQDEMVAMMLQTFSYIEKYKGLQMELENLIEQMAVNKTSMSTTIHLVGSISGKTFFTTSAGDPKEGNEMVELNYSADQKSDLAKAYQTMMKYLKMAHDKGVLIRIGTDCRQGGKALLSEMKLLHEAGFSIEDILQIATYNGAKAIQLDDQLGLIERGKRADLVIFDESPFEDPKNFLSGKTVVKGGQILAKTRLPVR